MEINTAKMCSNEIRKAAMLLTKASELGLDLSGSGVVDVNETSGNVYLWLEDSLYSLYIGPSGDDEIWALVSCPNCGEEHEVDLGTLLDGRFGPANDSTINEWASTKLNSDGRCCNCETETETEGE